LSRKDHDSRGALGEIAGTREDGADGAILDRIRAAGVDGDDAGRAGNGAIHQGDIAQGIIESTDVKRAPVNRQVAGGQERARDAKSQNAIGNSSAAGVGVQARKRHGATGSLGKIARTREDGADGAILHGEGTTAIHRDIAGGAGDGAANQGDIAEDVVQGIYVEDAAINRKVAGGGQRATYSQSQGAAVDGGAAGKSILAGEGHGAAGALGQIGGASEDGANIATGNVVRAAGQDAEVAGEIAAGEGDHVNRVAEVAEGEFAAVDRDVAGVGQNIVGPQGQRAAGNGGITRIRILTGKGHDATRALGEIAGARENGADGAVLHVEGTGAVDRHVAGGAGEGAVNQGDIAQDIIKRIHIKRSTGDGQIAGGREGTVGAEGQDAVGDGRAAGIGILAGQSHGAGGIFS